MSQNDKLRAAGKMLLGVGKVVGGVATATGHGIVGSYLRSHHMTGTAIRLAQQNCKSGAKLFEEGLRELNG